MVDFLILLAVLLIILDLLNTIFLRELVYSFLLSKRNIKGARKIHRSQTRKSRLTLSYIREYAIYEKEFSLFHRLWMINLASMLPQYLLITIALIISSSIAFCLIAVFVFFKMIMLFVIRSQFLGPHRISRFDKRYYERK